MNRSRSNLLRGLAIFAILGALLVGLMTPAGAQTDGTLVLRRLNTGGKQASGKNTADITYTGDKSALDGLKVTENGTDRPLDGKPVPYSSDRIVVFVLDSGPEMNARNLLTVARESIEKFVAAHPGGRFAVVQAGDRADIKSDVTSDAGRVKAALSSIGPTEKSSIWNALTLAGGLLEDQPDRAQRNIVLVSADADTTPIASLKTNPEPLARTAVLTNHAALWSVEFPGSGDPAAVHSLVEKAGGLTFTPNDGTAVAFGGQIEQAGKVIFEQQYEFSYTSPVADGELVHVEISVGGQTATADVLAGRGSFEGYDALHPILGTKAATLPFVNQPAFFAVALLLVLMAVGGAAYALSSIFLKEDLSDVLMPYSDAYATSNEDDEGMTKNALIKRAVALTEQVAENRGMLVRAEAALERANLPLRAGEALFVYVVIVIVATMLPLIAYRNLVAVLLFGIIGAMLPVKVVGFIANKRRKNFLGQLPDTLSLLSGTLRAGYSLMQGVEAVSQEVTEPMGLELRRVVTESRLGRPLEESMESSAERMDSPDFAWAVMAIRIQREVGGNLSELLLTVADTMVARERLRRDVAALTAEGRVSASVLAFMPPALGGVMYVLNKEYVSKLFTEALGIGMLVVAGVSMLIGFLWMKKIITIEI